MVKRNVWYKCPYCDAPFLSPYELAIHLLSCNPAMAGGAPNDLRLRVSHRAHKRISF